MPNVTVAPGGVKEHAEKVTAPVLVLFIAINGAYDAPLANPG
jgi:hypothetical protein